MDRAERIVAGASLRDDRVQCLAEVGSDRVAIAREPGVPGPDRRPLEGRGNGDAGIDVVRVGGEGLGPYAFEILRRPQVRAPSARLPGDAGEVQRTLLDVRRHR